MPIKHSYAIFSCHFRPHLGGLENFTERLANQLHEQGHDIVVVTPKLDDSPECQSFGVGFDVVRLPCYPLMDGRLPISRKNKRYRELMSEVETRGVDRVLVNTRFYRHSLEGLRFAQRISVPSVVLDHGSAHLTLGSKYADWFVERYEHAITERVKRFNPHFAGISKASIDWLKHFGIFTNDIIPNAIDVDEFCQAASERDYRKELCIDKSQKLVAFVGRITPEKGAVPFAEAAGILGEEYVLALAGKGTQQEQIEALGLSNVILLGMLQQEDLSALLRDADVFCLPTRSEGFCTSLLEAGAWGTTPIITRVGGTEEIMGNPAQYGVYLEDRRPSTIAAAIEKASMNDGKLDTLPNHIRRNCSWSKTAEALDKAFSS